jgi:hypothetical protein
VGVLGKIGIGAGALVAGLMVFGAIAGPQPQTKVSAHTSNTPAVLGDSANATSSPTPTATPTPTPSPTPTPTAGHQTRAESRIPRSGACTGHTRPREAGLRPQLLRCLRTKCLPCRRRLRGRERKRTVLREGSSNSYRYRYL